MSKQSEAFESALMDLIHEYRKKGCSLDDIITGLEIQTQVLVDEQAKEDE